MQHDTFAVEACNRTKVLSPTIDTDSADTVEVKPRQKTLLMRIITGLGAAAGAIAGIFLPEYHGLPFVIGVSVISIIAVSEFYRAVRKQGAEPSELLGVIACIVFQFGAWKRAGSTLDPFLPAFLALLVLITMLVELVKPKHKPILNIGATLLGAIYCGWLFSYIVLLHGSHLPIHIPIVGTTAGQWIALLVIATTSFGDVGGWLFGSLIGKHKLAPSISPSKTWEGAAGSVIVAAAVACAIGHFIHFPVYSAMALGAGLGIIGLIGDLCESALKRELGVKDFGIILPGHGGILDRIDSILFTAPVSYYYLMLFFHVHS